MREQIMSPLALFITLKTLPGRRDELRSIWEKHIAPAILANPEHMAYFCCIDNNDPDVMCAFQQYTSAKAANNFLLTTSYSNYLKEAEPLLTGPPQITALTPIWSKLNIGSIHHTSIMPAFCVH
jgi:quinol monooxygenase YgiN